MNAAILLMGVCISLTSSAALNLFATYEVPADQGSGLENSNQFQIRQLSLVNEPDGTTKLNYLLPVELTGNRNKIEMVGKVDDNGKIQFDYEKSRMDCQEDQISLTCNVAFQNLNLNQTLAQQLMEAKFKNNDLRNRLQVLEKFSTDPVGIIRIYKRPYLSYLKKHASK